MGIDPYAPPLAVILNGTFDVIPPWYWMESWAIHDGAAWCDPAAFPADNWIAQDNIDFVIGNHYRLQYEVLVWDTAAVDDALWINISGNDVEVDHSVGTHQVDFCATEVTGTIIFEVRGTVLPGDSFVIDNVVLILITSYLGDFLGFSPARPVTQEVFPAVAADYYGRLNSWKDKSSCLFLFDL